LFKEEIVNNRFQRAIQVHSGISFQKLVRSKIGKAKIIAREKLKKMKRLLSKADLHPTSHVAPKQEKALLRKS